MPGDAPSRPLKVMLLCTGAGLLNRGFETFFTETFTALRGSSPDVDIHLVKGGRATREGEHRVWCVPRTTALARAISKLTRRPLNAVEYFTAVPAVCWWILRHRPDVIYYPDEPLMRRLWTLKPLLGFKFKALFHNGGPMDPPFAKPDHVHQTAPFYLEQALAAGEPASKHTVLPLPISVPTTPISDDPQERAALRERLDLPAERVILLSVGWISSTHKRMDHLIRELAQIPEERRPFAVLLGAMDEGSEEIRALARQLLRPTDYVIRSVPPPEVAAYYRAADLFALGSLKEGYGLAYVEALSHGLPILAHDHPVQRFVLGETGLSTMPPGTEFVDMAAPGALAQAIEHRVGQLLPASQRLARREALRAQISWEVLRPKYLDLFRKVARG